MVGLDVITHFSRKRNVQKSECPHKLSDPIYQAKRPRFLLRYSRLALKIFKLLWGCRVANLIN
jgi:hypothetical protein